ncbi:unnamed protein product [Tuber aestivum]|uniref:Uncharacterized protein n=1 Tax=Tuber aestivum TaxID=59557 RepID=A0A292PLI1_9PEZI|nr:unnamed protein product [Tuber aestivum]
MTIPDQISTISNLKVIAVAAGNQRVDNPLSPQPLLTSSTTLPQCISSLEASWILASAAVRFPVFLITDPRYRHEFRLYFSPDRTPPLDSSYDIINTVNALLYQSVSAVETFLLSSPPGLLGFTPPPGTIPDTDGDGNVIYSEKEEEEINKGIHQLETLLENGVDKRFDAFELYVLRNILVVPQDLVGWVRLAHHKNLDFTSITPSVPTDPDSSEPTADAPALPPAHEAQSRLRTLRQTLLASHALNQTLQSEVSSNERTLAQLRALASSSDNKNPFSFINLSSMSTKELKDTASFAVSQIGLIRSLIAQLKPKYAELQRRKEQQEASGDKMDVDEEVEGREEKGTPEEERKKYIEKMTRRHMESSRGLRLNAKGEVVGGGSEENVARKGLGEVEELEGLVEGLHEGDP